MLLPVLARPASARRPRRSSWRWSRGASVATTMMMLPSPPLPRPASRLPNSRPTGTPAMRRSPPKLLWTRTPTVHPPWSVARRRLAVPIPAFRPKATVARPDVVQEAVVRLGHDGVGRADGLVAGQAEQVGEDGIRRAGDAQRAREHDGRLQLPQLGHLGGPHQLAEPGRRGHP